MQTDTTQSSETRFYWADVAVLQANSTSHALLIQKHEAGFSLYALTEEDPTQAPPSPVARLGTAMAEWVNRIKP